MSTTNEYIIKANGLSKSFQIDAENCFYAVREIDLEVNKGEIILINGPNGSGKTTLLSMIGGMLRPSYGTISVMNKTITNMKQNGLSYFRKNNIGFIFQTFRLIDALKVNENIELVLNLNGIKRPESLKTTTSLLKQLNISHKSNSFPDVLSGGEKQRVAIARAIANEPEIILADEPTGSLDSKAGLEIIGLLVNISKEAKKTVLIVSHDSRINKFADRLIQMEDGQIIS